LAVFYTSILYNKFEAEKHSSDGKQSFEWQLMFLCAHALCFGFRPYYCPAFHVPSIRPVLRNKPKFNNEGK